MDVRLLGSVEVILDGQRLRAFDSIRLQRFLALIALRDDLQHRSRLAFELWPDSSEPQARTNLRKLLHELRGALPDIEAFVEIGKETVRWLATGASEVDVLRFRDAVDASDLERAARLYGGDLLPACYDDWVLEERAELRDAVQTALAWLARQAAEHGDHASALEHARHLTALEPTDEGAVRAEMEAHVALGDRTAALRCYHRYGEALQRGLGLTPGPAIESLYEQLRAGVPARSGITDEVHESVAESPFVGRERELARLIELWDAAHRGGAHLVLVTGEPGIGKSRLAHELARRVRADGHAVVSARAYEAAGRPPWGPVVDLLRSEDVRGQIEALDAAWKTELARLMPELTDVRAAPGSAGSADLAQRRRLFDAVARAIVSGDQRRLLIVDDLQWCDTETIELLGFLVRAAATEPLLIVGTVRMEEIGEHHPLDELVTALGRDRTVTTLPLTPLDELATTELAARLSADDMIDPELAARLWGETEGNPLFVVEAIRAGISSAGTQPLLTPTVRTVLGARLEQLPDDARRVAEVAAVFGRPFTIELMLSATDLDEDELVDHLDALWRRRIIRDHGPAYDFSHDKLRAVALEMVSPARRRQLHGAIARAIEAEFADDLPAVAAQLAAHYDQAGKVRPAIDAYRAAGARAVAVSALEEAVASYRRALALLAELPASAERDELELDIRIALGSPLVALEGYGSRDAHQLYERALALCRRFARPVDAPILRGLGLARLQGCRFDDTDQLGQALVEHASDDPVARTEGSYLLGVSAFWRGDLAKARHHLEKAVASYDTSRREEHLALFAQDPRAVCGVRLAWVELWEGDPGRGDETARLALERATEHDHLMTLWYVTIYAAIVAAESDDLVRLAELLGEADRLWERVPMPYLMIVGEALRAWLAVREGSVGGVEDIARAVQRSRVEGETLHLTYTLLLLARARAAAGEHRQARAAVREGLAWSRRHGQGYLEAELSRVDAELAYRAGESEAAAASLREAVELSNAQGASWLELRALCSLSTLFPDRASLRRLEALVGAIPSGHDLPAFRAAVELVRARG